LYAMIPCDSPDSTRLEQRAQLALVHRLGAAETGRLTRGRIPAEIVYGAAR